MVPTSPPWPGTGNKHCRADISERDDRANCRSQRRAREWIARQRPAAYQGFQSFEEARLATGAPFLCLAIRRVCGKGDLEVDEMRWREIGFGGCCNCLRNSPP